MSVRPLLLPDTASVAGYDHLDPITQWFLGGSGTAGAEATGISDDDRYGLDLSNGGSGGKSFRTTSGNGTYQLRVDNSGVALVGGLNVTGTTTFYSPVVLNSTLSVTGAATFATGVVMQTSLTVTGGVVFQDSLVVTGAASFNGDVTLGNNTSDTITIKGPLYTESDMHFGNSSGDNSTFAGAVTVTGTSTFRSAVTVYSATGNDQVLYLKHNSTAGAFTLGATDSTAPDLVFKDATGAETFRVGDQASDYQATVTGNLRVTDEAYVADALVIGATAVSSGEELRVHGTSLFEGAITITTGGIEVTGTSTFNSAVSFNDPVTISDSLSVVGTTLTLNTAYIDFDIGSGAGFTEDGWSGYVTAKYDGNTIYIPYLSSAP